MKTYKIFSIIAAVSLLTVFSCGKEIQPVEEDAPVEQPETIYTYSFSIDAGKGSDDPGSKALTLEGKTLSATWAVNDEVTVYNETKGEALSGTLRAQSAGTSTTLKGDLSSSKGIAVDDVLTLKFLSPSYDSQEGTIEYIASHCDYATASVTVTSVSGSDIRTGTASFENQQAIVGFALSNPYGSSLETRSIKIIADERVITVASPSTISTAYVALPAISGKKLVLGVTSYQGSYKYYYLKSSVTFESGKFYSISVKMKEGTIVFNESELNSAVSANMPYIVLGSDIPLSNYVQVNGSKDITLDLCGRTLSRSLANVDSNGHVIEVFSGNTLTVKDSSGNNSGKIKGGRANNGGGICNYGTLYFQGGTITDCMANSDEQDSGRGGAIVNHGTMVMSGGTLLGCWGKDCGGVWNDGSLTISGGSISGNTSNAGGGGVVNYATATITGGTIHNNTATTRGGGIWNSGTLTLNGTINIIGNKGTNYAGGICNIGTLNLQGNVNVTGNTDSDGLSSNLWLGNGTVINITGIIEGASIGVSRENNTGTVTAGLEGRGTESNFSNDFPVLANMQISGGELVLGVRTGVVHYISRQWSSGSVLSSMEYVESGNYTQLTTNANQALALSNGGWYVVSGNIVLERIIIQSGTANLILCDGSSLESNVAISSAATLNIYAQLHGTGILNAKYWGKNQDGASMYNTPGICGYNSRMGTLNVYGGIVNSSCDYNPDDAVAQIPGIGGHSVADSDTETIARGDRNGGILNVYGGSVTAKGSTNCAGIGGANKGDGGEVTIYGGTVTAVAKEAVSAITSADGGAGIGGGSYGKGGTVTIYGGSVNATGGDGTSNGVSGAGIGGGGNGGGGTVTIYGGNVVAIGGNDAAGIGSGEEAATASLLNIDGGTITITGGFVQAWGTDEGAGIGAGQGAASGIITINGGTVIAHGGENSNAICTHDTKDGAYSISIGNNMRLRSSDNIFSYLARASIESYKDIQIEPCPHNGSPCDWCMYGH